MSSTSNSGNSEEYRTTYTEHQSLTPVIVEAIASVTGKDCISVGPLYEMVDLEELTDVLRTVESGHVEFTAHGCRVTVDAGGEIVVSPAE